MDFNGRMNIRLILLTCLSSLALELGAAEPYPDRFVWIFGWGLGQDKEVVEISRVIETASQHGINGAVVSFGLDTLCQQSADYFRRLDEIKQVCQRNNVELIPAGFSVGYGGGFLAHDPNLAEGLPVEDAPFQVQGGEARLVVSNSAQIVNGGFEDHAGNALRGFDFHDQPGEISFIDGQVKHSGNASLRRDTEREFRCGFWCPTERRGEVPPQKQPASLLPLSTRGAARG